MPGRPRIGLAPSLVQSALIADADGVPVVPYNMGTTSSRLLPVKTLPLDLKLQHEKSKSSDIRHDFETIR